MFVRAGAADRRTARFGDRAGAPGARGKEVWAEDWLSGEENMCHSIGNLEHHHFKYRDFRQPGDVHVHFFGAATGSFTKKIETKVGDVFEIQAAQFGRPLRNPLGAAREKDNLVAIRAL